MGKLDGYKSVIQVTGGILGGLEPSELNELPGCRRLVELLSEGSLQGKVTGGRTESREQPWVNQLPRLEV